MINTKIKVLDYAMLTFFILVFWYLTKNWHYVEYSSSISLLLFIYYVLFILLLFGLIMILNNYSGNYFSLTIDIMIISFVMLINWRKTGIYIVFYFNLLIIGVVIGIIIIKIYIVISLMIGNIIDIYLIGIIIVMVNWLLYSNYDGVIMVSYILYLFMVSYELIILILLILELLSIVFQSLTLSNRLSINILAGGLLISLLSIIVFIMVWNYNYYLSSILLIILLIILNNFEYINLIVQIFIFSILGMEYLH